MSRDNKIHGRNMSATTAILVAAAFLAAMYVFAQLPDLAAAAEAITK